MAVWVGSTPWVGSRLWAPPDPTTTDRDQYLTAALVGDGTSTADLIAEPLLTAALVSDGVTDAELVDEPVLTTAELLVTI